MTIFVKLNFNPFSAHNKMSVITLYCVFIKAVFCAIYHNIFCKRKIKNDFLSYITKNALIYL